MVGEGAQDILETAIPQRDSLLETGDRTMNMDARIRELNERHKRIEAALASEMKHPTGDEGRVHELKRKKLRLKDQIAQLRSM